MKIGRTSFLKDLAPETYNTLSDWKPFAFFYILILLFFFILSLFLQWSIIEFFISIMMGWTLLSIPFIGIIIVSLDKEIEVPVPEYSYEFVDKKKIKKSRPYVFSKIWGISLCVLGCILLYFSNKYKSYYSFQCQTFYLETFDDHYHIFEDCDDIYLHSDLDEIEGVDLLNGEYELCKTCKERAEDLDMDAYDVQFRRR